VPTDLGPRSEGAPNEYRVREPRGALQREPLWQHTTATGETVPPLQASGGSPVTTFLSVVSSLLVGLVLVVAPWTTLWENNYLIVPHATLRAIVLSAFTRGAVSGLGLVNLVLALYEFRGHWEDERARR
jgi:hypothetical protein